MSAATGATVWERGRFDGRDRPHELLFGMCYEDASIERTAFRPGGRVLCIASAGCTAIHLAPRHEVVAVDINPAQVAYVEQRLAGGNGRRGAAERILSRARALAPLAGWRKARVRAFLDLEEPAEQVAFWHRHLDTWRFRTAFDALFSVPALRSTYATRFLHFLPSNFGAVMRRRMERCFALHPNRTNPYARALLLGSLTFEPPPPDRSHLQLVHADAVGFLEGEPPGSFDGFTLSNILDGAGAAYGRRLFAAVARAAAPGAVAVLRSFREPGLVQPTNHAAEDRAMLWGVVDVRPAIALASPAEHEASAVEAGGPRAHARDESPAPTGA